MVWRPAMDNEARLVGRGFRRRPKHRCLRAGDRGAAPADGGRGAACRHDRGVCAPAGSRRKGAGGASWRRPWPSGNGAGKAGVARAHMGSARWAGLPARTGARLPACLRPRAALFADGRSALFAQAPPIHRTRHWSPFWSAPEPAPGLSQDPGAGSGWGRGPRRGRGACRSALSRMPRRGRALPPEGCRGTAQAAGRAQAGKV